MISEEQKPLVSLIITSYNRADLVEKAIQSALKQDYANLEIIVSDNCSSDNSDAVIKRYCNDPRINYVRNENNLGMLLNFKKATEKIATGKFVTYVSSDDYLINDSFISEAIAKFSLDENLVIYSGVSKNYYFETQKEAHNSTYEYKTKNNLFNKSIAGKEVFLHFEESHLLNFGGTIFFREDLVRLDIFRDPNTTYFDLQAILLLSLKGNSYLSDKVCYVQTFHDSNASQALANPAKTLTNLNFAEIPFEEAVRQKFLPTEKLNEWLCIVLLPFISYSLINFYKTDKAGYKVFYAALKTRHPEILKKITGTIKWKIFKLVYGNKITASLYEKLKH